MSAAAGSSTFAEQGRGDAGVQLAAGGRLQIGRLVGGVRQRRGRGRERLRLAGQRLVERPENAGARRGRHCRVDEQGSGRRQITEANDHAQRPTPRPEALGCERERRFVAGARTDQITDVLLEQRPAPLVKVRERQGGPPAGGDRARQRLGGPRRASRRLGEPQDLSHEREVLARERQRLAEPFERARPVAGPFLGDPGRLLEEPRSRAAVLQRGQPVRDQIEQQLPAVRPLGRSRQRRGRLRCQGRVGEQGGQAGARRLVRRLDLERAPIPADRAARVIEAKAQGVAQAGQPIGVHAPIDARALREQLPQLAEAAALGQQIDERIDARVVLGEPGRDLAPGVDRLPEIARPRPGQERDLDQIRADLVLRRRALDPPPQQIDEHRPALRLEQERAARRQRLVVCRVDRQPPVPGGERPIDVPAPTCQLRDPGPGEALVRGLGLRRRQALEDVESRRRVAELVVQELQPAERLHPELQRCHLLGGRRGEQRRRLRLAAGLAILDPRGAHQELDPPLGHRRGARRRGEAARQGDRVAAQLRELPQPVLDLVVLGQQGAERDVLLERTGDVAERAPPLPALPAQRLQALALRKGDRDRQQLGDARRAPRGIEPPAQRIEHLEPRFGRGPLVEEDLLQPLREARGSVGACQDRAQGLDGLGRPAELGVQRGREPQSQLARLLAGQRLEPQPPDGAELVPAPLALEEALQRRGDLRVQRSHPEQPIEVSDRPGAVPREVLGDARRLAQQLGPLVVPAPSRQPRVIGVEHVGPTLGHRERDDQRAKSPVSVRRRRQHGAQDVDRLGGVLAEAVCREPDRPMRDDLVQRPGELRHQLRAIGVEQPTRLRLVGGRRLLEPPPRRVVAWLADGVVQCLVDAIHGERPGPSQIDP